jgi:hypothetical protein
MPRTIFLVQTEPVAGREDEYHEWYTNQHLDDLLAVPGFVAAQRFTISPQQRPGTTPPKFAHLAIYDIEGDPQAALASLAEARAGGMLISDALGPESAAHVYTSITELRQ